MPGLDFEYGGERHREWLNDPVQHKHMRGSAALLHEQRMSPKESARGFGENGISRHGEVKKSVRNLRTHLTLRRRISVFADLIQIRTFSVQK
jgi:hypothetical protein